MDIEILESLQRQTAALMRDGGCSKQTWQLANIVACLIDTLRATHTSPLLKDAS